MFAAHRGHDLAGALPFRGAADRTRTRNRGSVTTSPRKLSYSAPCYLLHYGNLLTGTLSGLPHQIEFSSPLLRFV